jgi:hypothetical protein
MSSMQYSDKEEHFKCSHQLQLDYITRHSKDILTVFLFRLQTLAQNPERTIYLKAFSKCLKRHQQELLVKKKKKLPLASGLHP